MADLLAPGQPGDGDQPVDAGLEGDEGPEVREPRDGPLVT